MTRTLMLLVMMTAGVAVGQQQPMAKDAKPGFEVATIKPSDPAADHTDIDMVGTRFVVKNYPLGHLIAFAYGLHRDQILNGPAWMKERFDINGVPDVPGDPTVPQMQIMLQKLLETRFGLKFHRDQKEMPMYAITLGKGAVKMPVSTHPEAEGPDIDINNSDGRRTVTFTNSTMDEFALGLQSFFLEKPVVNQTGLKPRYDFKLTWRADLNEQDNVSDVPTLFTAFPEQLGLKIEAKKGPVEVLLVDALSRPTEN